MNRFKDTSAEIDDWKISISKAVFIHAVNNLNSQFWSYLAMLSYDAWEKAKLKLLTFSKPTKTDLANKK